MYWGKSHIIAWRNGWALLRNKQKYNCTTYMQVVLIRLMSKIECLIMPKETQFTGLGKFWDFFWQKSVSTFQSNIFSVWISMEGKKQNKTFWKHKLNASLFAFNILASYMEKDILSSGIAWCLLWYTSSLKATWHMDENPRLLLYDY